MDYVPWPGFGPFESYEADHTVDGGETLELAGLTFEVVFTPGHSPGHVTYALARRGRAVLGRRPLPGLGRPRRPARRRLADAAGLDRDADRRAYPAETTVYPGHMGITTLGARARHQSVPARARAPQPVRAVLSVIQAPTRHVRRPPGSSGAARAVLEAHARADPRRRRLPADRDADVRGDRAVRARGRRGDRHRAEGDVHVRRRRRPLADAAPGGDRAGLPRLPRARDAQAAPAREALVPVELLPRRGAAARPLPPVLAGRRRGDRLRRARDRRRADRAAGRAARGARGQARPGCGWPASALPRPAPSTARS